MSTRSHRIALVQWSQHDELHEGIADEICALGHTPLPFLYDTLPPPSDLVITFAPLKRWLPLARRIGQLPADQRPPLTHWNFEGFPNPRLPWSAIRAAALARSRLDGVPLLERKFLRYRYPGDYLDAFQHGWLHTLAQVSEIYTRVYRAHGIPAHFVPWGTSPNWYADQKLERDIDVLWLGKRRTDFRSTLIDEVRVAVTRAGGNMLVIDGVEHPFVFGKTRTELLNRSKLVLNVKSLAHNSGFTFRFHMAAGNRVLVVSEDFDRHVPYYQPGVHFVSVPRPELPDAVVHWLHRPAERRALAENAYNLVTTQLTLNNSVAQLLELSVGAV